MAANRYAFLSLYVFMQKKLTPHIYRVFQAAILLLWICMGTSVHSLAQQTSNARSYSLTLQSDTTALDSLSIIPESFKMQTMTGEIIPNAYFQLLSAQAFLIAGDSLKSLFPLQLTISYRVFPIDFSAPFFRKKQGALLLPDAKNPFIYRASANNTQQQLLDFGTLSKNGSISRGVNFGNNQDLVINSSMNIQLAGKIGDDIDLLAAISDNNIPIQPEGNTAQIQEFDKVFIKLSKDNTQLTAGDFELGKPPSYFMNLNKKAQGGYFSTLLPVSKEDSTTSINLSVAAAVSKGKFARNPIQGMEGNQGPYKLTGSDNEQFIIILAGSEKVYLDGRLLSRARTTTM